MNEFYKFASSVISDRAVIEHEAKCADPDNCSDWHIRNDFIPRIRSQVITEMREAIRAMESNGG